MSCTWTVSAYRSLATLTLIVSVRPTWDFSGRRSRHPDVVVRT
jgi:hypothetical protein